MPINSQQLAYFTSLTTDQLSNMIVQSGGQTMTFTSASFKEIINPSLPAYTFNYNAYDDAANQKLVSVTYDSSDDTVTTIII